MRPTGNTTAPAPVLAPDELPRSKYEPREEAAGRPMTLLAFGVIIANAFLMLKDMLHGKAPAQASPHPDPIAPAETAEAGQAGPAPRPDGVLPAPANDGGAEEAGHEPGGEASLLGAPSGRAAKFFLRSGPVTMFEQGDSFVPPKLGLGGALKSLPVRAAQNDNPLPDGAMDGGLAEAALARAASAGGGEGGGGRDAPGSSGSVGEAGSSGEGPGVGDTVDGADGAGGSNGPGSNGSGSNGPGNRAPGASNAVFLYEIFISQSVLIGLAQLLAGASDADGDVLDVANLTVSSGEIVKVAPGLWRFTAEAEWLGEVTFSYDITDGTDATAQTARLEVVQLPGERITGTDEADLLIGTPGDDLIEGLDGADDILGREGRDVIDGGDGNDRIAGGSGGNVIYGGAGADVIFGGDGADTIYGGDGDDQIFGGAGNDLIFAGLGNDRVEDGAGSDVADLGDGDDTMLVSDDGTSDVMDGGLGAGDTIDLSGIGPGRMAEISLADGVARITAVTPPPAGGQAGAEAGDTAPADRISGFENVTGSQEGDLVIGDGGANRIIGGGGDDTASGGGGDDCFVASDHDGRDVYDGGEGRDTLDASAVAMPITIDLMGGTVSSAGGETDTISSIETVRAGSGDDIIIAGFGQNDLSGGRGDDVFVFRTTAVSGKGSGSRDRILDYSVGDRVDLDGIMDECAPAALTEAIADEGIRKFVMIRDGQEFSRPGEIKIGYESLDGQQVAVLMGNVDYDPGIDFEIEIHGLMPDQFHF